MVGGHCASLARLHISGRLERRCFEKYQRSCRTIPWRRESWSLSRTSKGYL